MRRRRSVLAPAAGLLSCLAAAPTAYLALLSASGVASARRDRRRPTRSGGDTRFAVLIPAHDEEASIGDAVRALVDQRYPTDRRSVHVVADNCTDRTADAAARAGADVHVREAPEDPGKGAALNWLTERIIGDGTATADALVVVDADTVADPSFLAALDRAFRQGADAVQGLYGVRDPEASESVALRYAALACRHHLRPLGRAALGASCGLYGNGMAFRAELLRDRRWTGHLIEDMEFQLALLLDGIPVRYVPDARIAAEMPTTLGQADSQNERWEAGRIQLARRFAGPLARRVVRGGSLRRRVYADALIDQLVPPLSVLAALDVAALGLGALSFAVRPSPGRAVAPVVGAGAVLVLVAHVVVALVAVRAPAGVYRALLASPRAIVWKLALLGRVARRPDRVDWTRTARNADLERA